MQTFSFNAPIILIEKGKWLSGVKSFEATNMVFKKTDENNSLSITIPGYWNFRFAEKIIDKLKKSLEFRSENDIELHTKQVKEKGFILIKDYSSSSLDGFRNEILEELKTVNDTDLEDMVYRFQLTYSEIIDIFDLNYNPTKKQVIQYHPECMKSVILISW